MGDTTVAVWWTSDFHDEAGAGNPLGLLFSECDELLCELYAPQCLFARNWVMEAVDPTRVVPKKLRETFERLAGRPMLVVDEGVRDVVCLRRHARL